MKVRRPELVVAAAVAVCLPMVPGILSGAISPMAGLLRLLIALIICWAAGAMLSTLFSRFFEEARRAQIVQMIEKARENATSEQATTQQALQSSPTQSPANKPSV